DRIKIGVLAETELAAARAEVALRREALINARSSLATTRLGLLRLLNPPGPGLWGREVVLRDEPGRADVELGDVEKRVADALKRRPDLNQARLGIERGEIELVKTRNGLLPKMDLFVTLGASGYASSFRDSVENVNGDNYDATVGVSLSHVIGRRDARARHRRAELSQKQTEMALENLSQLAQVDVRSAFIEVGRAGEQVTATEATRTFREEALRAETEKFRVGKSTTLLVAQAQRDLVESKISADEAIVSHLKALVDLYRAEGTLLDRRRIDAPGGAAD
ncbi:MAG: TolC family protein, partial [Planctomycetota bacterium]